jgi:hypothetical protein
MLRLKIELLSNQYHASPWEAGRESAKVEWPPSPLRLLRAIAYGGFTAQLDPQPLVMKLAQSLPSYYLPQGTWVQTNTLKQDYTSDTRLYKNGKDLWDGSLRFSEGSAIYVYFPLELTDQEQQQLTASLERLTYVGRATSPARWSTVSQGPEANCLPSESGLGDTFVPVGTTWASFEKTTWDMFYTEARSEWPGLKWAAYDLPKRREYVTAPQVDVWGYRYNLTGTYLPGKHHFLSYAQALHQILTPSQEPNLIGVQEGEPIKSDHCRILPVFNDRHLIALELLSPRALTPREQYFCQRAQKVWAKGGTFDITPEPIYVIPTTQHWQSTTPFFLYETPAFRKNGKPQNVKGTQHQKSGPEHQALKFLARHYLDIDPKACTWESHDEKLALLLEGNVVAIAAATPWEDSLRWMSRRKNQRPSSGRGYYLHLQTAQKLPTTISLGWGAYFGAGALKPPLSNLSAPPEHLLAAAS